MRKNRKRTRPRAFSFLFTIFVFGVIFLGLIFYTPFAQKSIIISALFTMPDALPSYISQTITLPSDTSSADIDEFIPIDVADTEVFVDIPPSNPITETPITPPADDEKSSSSQVGDIDENTSADITLFEVPTRKSVETTLASSGSGTSYIKYKSGYIRNYTSLTSSEISKILQKKPNISLDEKDDVQVLIFHTHATESFDDDELYALNSNYAFRTTDKTKNMVAVGDVIEKQLKAAGIGVLHDTTLHDYPSYNGSYDRSSVTIDNYLKDYPNIQIMLDIHRDAIEQEDGTLIRPITTINGKKAAQIMIISGCGEGQEGFARWQENLRFAATIQNSLESNYKGITRPIMFCYRRYNMHKANGSLLIEIGSHGNSLDEAIYSGELLGKSLVEVILSLKNKD